ncbi:TIGR03620 family F420-dependent LLM class oxidoreductase [Novosphingobium sp. MW5]|nr:TIGR03620 family F420-dependent LLM class oxidoreductase [Novosphingobium sp. MW5]
MDLGKVGVWSMELRFGDKAEAARGAAEIEALGYGAIWVPGGIGGDITGDLDHLLNATSRIPIATGIINIWKHEPAEIAAWFNALPDDHRDRVMLGLGVSHGPLIGENWNRPVAKMAAWLDAFEAAGMPLKQTCLAALGPKMLELAGQRTAGAHPYLVPPAHSAEARAIMGPGKLVAPEQGVVLDPDPASARAKASEALVHYRRLPNYVNSWKRLGFTDADIESESDALLGGIFAMGDAGAIAARVREHHDAGADHVCIQTITGGAGLAQSLSDLRELAKALL